MIQPTEIDAGGGREEKLVLFLRHTAKLRDYGAPTLAQRNLPYNVPNTPHHSSLASPPHH